MAQAAIKKEKPRQKLAWPESRDAEQEPPRGDGIVPSRSVQRVERGGSGKAAQGET